MHNIYFYPKVDYKIAASPNAYISNLELSVSREFTIVNRTYNNKGVLDFFPYLFKANAYLFNWIENLPFKRYGKSQTIVFSIFLFCAKFLGKKVIWVLHNKYPHDQAKNKWTDFMFRIMMKNSDLILTHSTGGIDFVKEKFPRAATKIKYMIHPVLEKFPTSSESDKLYDFLIWGVIYSYKGMLEFLEFITKTNNVLGIRILIVGRCFDAELKKELKKYLSEKIVHIDKFLEIEQISRFANLSKFILFTYKSPTVLSSGALMDSIRMNSIIIGPNTGAFKDLSSFCFVKVYDDYTDIVSIYNNYRSFQIPSKETYDHFFRGNSWEKFSEKISKEINRLFN
jgi:hypothetical protein